MYPSERYAYLIDGIHKDFREQVRDYVDESYHQGIEEVINALARYVHSHVYKSKYAHLIDDYNQFLEGMGYAQS